MRQAAPRPRAGWGLAAAAILVVVLGASATFLYVWPARERGAAPLPHPVTLNSSGESDSAELAISRWQSPTAFLLEPPDGSL